MTTSLNGKNPLKVNGEDYEDLTRMRGIGPVKQQWLRESLNIYTFQNLADLSVDKIQSMLMSRGHSVSRREIKGWIVQAQELAAGGLPSKKIVKYLDVQSESWVAELPLAVELVQIRIFQPHQTKTPMVVERGARFLPGTISSSEPFAIEITFNFVGLNVANFTKQQVTYSTHFYARNRLIGVKTHLGDTEPNTLIKGQLLYKAMLAKTTLEPGIYRLQAIVNAQGMPAPLLGRFKIPLLQVF